MWLRGLPVGAGLVTPKELRTQAGLTLEAMARLVRVSPNAIKAWEAGTLEDGDTKMRLERVYLVGVKQLLQTAGVAT
jgi:transcriptional regulator with XRE-family HTH domain